LIYQHARGRRQRPEPDRSALLADLLRLARFEVWPVDVNTSVVYEHIRRTVLEPLNDCQRR
jgi:hypothetical protein